MDFVASVFCWLVVAAGQVDQRLESQAAPLLVDKPFHQALDQPFAATWKNIDLRTITGRITSARHIAILVDRRLDPSRTHSVAASGEAVGAFLERLAEESGGRTSTASNTIYLGPQAAAAKLRTLVALRQSELIDPNYGISKVRQRELARTTTFVWADLDRPVDLVDRLAKGYQLHVEGLNCIPHDLWAAAALPEATAAEALSMVLIQWDLTFEWIDQGRGIQLAPIPERVVIERRHRPSQRVSVAAALKLCREELPDLKARGMGGEIVARGTLEQHEALERLLRPVAVAPRPAPGPTVFTLRFKAPANSLLRKLSEPAFGQWRFEYDAIALRDAGIDLEQRISFEIKDAPIDQLLKAALDPLGLTFEIDDRTVRLHVQKP
ncbi:MAG: hypothetical protein EXS05_11825 [Planctomycetaceae bacterium]|nr:hypothetical protein [Planctomycetaceae bacterium]